MRFYLAEKTSWQTIGSNAHLRSKESVDPRFVSQKMMAAHWRLGVCTESRWCIFALTRLENSVWLDRDVEVVDRKTK